eukprot:GEMP01063812.1.p1 GENE.GEMP01063812.1~~GEMP01063812.1.p1  ORF type:complete len:310 (+),score=76.39 GEMP01063812.1:65-994(+)
MPPKRNAPKKEFLLENEDDVSAPINPRTVAFLTSACSVSEIQSVILQMATGVTRETLHSPLFVLATATLCRLVKDHPTASVPIFVRGDAAIHLDTAIRGFKLDDAGKKTLAETRDIMHFLALRYMHDLPPDDLKGETVAKLLITYPRQAVECVDRMMITDINRREFCESETRNEVVSAAFKERPIMACRIVCAVLDNDPSRFESKWMKLVSNALTNSKNDMQLSMNAARVVGKLWEVPPLRRMVSTSKALANLIDTEALLRDAGCHTVASWLHVFIGDCVLDTTIKEPKKDLPEKEPDKRKSIAKKRKP